MNQSFLGELPEFAAANISDKLLIPPLCVKLVKP